MQAAKAPPETAKPSEVLKASPETAKVPAKAKTPTGEVKVSPQEAGDAGATAPSAKEVSIASATPEAIPDVPADAAAGEPSVDEPTVTEVTAADPLFAYTPNHLYLEQPHRRGSVKVLLDGLPVSPENVAPAHLAQDKWGYQLKGVIVPRGAIVRIDFEPE